MAPRSRASLACENCRRRRIKCNQLRPRCSQCVRAGLVCSGYRNQIDLIFHDETAATARRANTRKESRSLIASTDSSDSDEASPPENDLFFPAFRCSPTSTIPSMDVEDFAWKYYFKNFNITRNNIDCFPEPYFTTSNVGMASVTSVGLAALALIHSDPHMMHLARKKYSAALRTLARTVTDPAELRKGTTATASFNLSMFEMITSDAPDAAYSWLRHIHGTAALMRVVYMPLKGAIYAVTGCLQVAFTIATGCLISETPVLADITKLVKGLIQSDIHVDVSPITELFTFFSSLVNLYIQSRKSNSPSGLHSPSRDNTALTTALAEIDSELIDWESRLPPLYTGGPHTGSYLHQDSANWIPRLWGYYRLCRILTHRVILDNTTLSPAKEEVSRKIIAEMCAAIYASVPSMLNKSFVNACYEPCLGLTSDVFFLVTILQALIKVTVKEDVVSNWAGCAEGELGGRFSPMRGFVANFLSGVSGKEDLN
ncbi:hypothetical protein BJY04DRAFT_217853 [Aspergillus karnatakaensis]|uniref:uncharacterized protein n=1 Tax=Aspergillus karnatakaensis TaxID=1810916 RepID=UPI003CCDAC05